MSGWIVFYVCMGALLLFLFIIIERAVMFVPPETKVCDTEEVIVDEEKIVQDMSAMIQCKTISYREDEKVDWGEYEIFYQLLKDRFPTLHQKATLTKVGKTGLLYFIKGKASDAPSVCMAHYDVVPIEEQGWTKPAFDGLVEDGCIWGRGTLDTKGTLCAILEAAEQLLQEGYEPKQDLYFSFSGEEEIDGNTCADIVSYLEEKGVKPAFVLDEGGAVVEQVFPGVKKPCALVGIGEKGSLNMNFSMDSDGGHASTPPVHTILGQLCEGVTKIEANPLRRQLTKPVAEMFDTLGRHSSFLYKIIFANLWCFAPVLDMICKKSGGELNAMMRTTVAVTRMEGSKAYNVLPPKASFGVNVRLLGEDTIESVTNQLLQIMGNEKIKAQVVNGMNPSIYSDTDCEAWDNLSQVIQSTWPEAVVSPYLMMACSDSRHYCRITDRVYRFSAMALSKEERAMIHGNDERIPIPTMVKTVKFYVRLLKTL